MQQFGWLPADLFRVIGWSIIHSLWQSLILLGILEAVLLLIHKKNSRLRYVLSVAILFGMLLCAISTIQHEQNKFSDTAIALNSVAKGFAYHTGPAQTPGITAGTAPVAAQPLDLSGYLTAISPYLAIGWIIGMLLFAAKLMHGWVYLNSLRKLPGESFQEAYGKLSELADRMGIKKNIRLIITSRVSAPLTFGFIKPVILLPFSYVLQAPSEHLEMILAHELSHIRRADYLVNLLQSTLEVIFFFNPFFYKISNIVRTEREYCCDDMAARFCGNKQTMAIALTNLKLLSEYPGLALAAAPLKSAFHKRIYRLIDPAHRFKLSFKMPFFTFILLFALLVLLTKCANDLNTTDILPQPKDSMKQLLSDNQAGHKIQIYGYSKANTPHELFLVSTTDGNPLYAYLDGNTLPATQLILVHEAIQQRRNISPEALKKIPQNAKELRMRRSQQVNREIDSIGLVIKKKEAALPTHHSASLQNELDASKKEFSARADEVKTLAMEDYKEDVKNIPVDVKLHELLSRIIKNKEYTAEERKELDELLKKRK